MINCIVIAQIILNVCIGLLCFRIGRRIGAKEGIDYCFDRMCDKHKAESEIDNGNDDC